MQVRFASLPSCVKLLFRILDTRQSGSTYEKGASMVCPSLHFISFCSTFLLSFMIFLTFSLQHEISAVFSLLFPFLLSLLTYVISSTLSFSKTVFVQATLFIFSLWFQLLFHIWSLSPLTGCFISLGPIWCWNAESSTNPRTHGAEKKRKYWKV